MQHFDQNITHAIRAAGLDRVAMLRLLDKHGLRPGRPAADLSHRP